MNFIQNLLWSVFCGIIAIGFYILFTSKHAAENVSVFPPPTVQHVASVDTAKFDTRIMQLRIAEYRGALFEQMALDYLRHGSVDLDRQIWAARQAALEVGKTADEFSREAINRGAEEFAQVVTEARKP